MFEELLAEHIQSNIKAYMAKTVQISEVVSVVYDEEVEVANDLFYEPLKENPQGVYIVMSVGNSTQSAIPQAKFTTDFLNIKILCDENKKTELFKAIDEYRDNFNAQFLKFVGTDETYNAQLSINKPFIIGNAWDLRTDNLEDGETETFGFITVQWIISAVYSDNVSLGAPDIKIEFNDGIKHTINGLIRYSFSENPNSVISQHEGAYRADRDNAVLTTTYVLNFQKIDGDALCDKLHKSFTGEDGSIYGQKLFLYIDGKLISCTDYTLDEDYENGVTNFTLTLIK